MKVEIKDIGPPGLRVTRRLDDAATRKLLQEGEFELLAEPAGVEVDLTLYLAEEAVVARGRVSGHFSVVCGRCLGICTITVDEPEATLTFLPPAELGPEEEELSAEDLDTAFHDGDTLDLAPMVREQLLLAIPITPLCDEECLGLCPSCGKNLNEGSCQCEKSAAETSPWVAALRQIKVKNPDN